MFPAGAKMIKKQQYKRMKIHQNLERNSTDSYQDYKGDNMRLLKKQIKNKREKESKQAN